MISNEKKIYWQHNDDVSFVSIFCRRISPSHSIPLQFSKDGTNCCLALPAQHMLNVFAIFFQLPGEISMEKQNLTRGHSAVVLTPKFAKTKAKSKSSHISLKHFLLFTCKALLELNYIYFKFNKVFKKFFLSNVTFIITYLKRTERYALVCLLILKLCFLNLDWSYYETMYFFTRKKERSAWDFISVWRNILNDSTGFLMSFVMAFLSFSFLNLSSLRHTCSCLKNTFIIQTEIYVYWSTRFCELGQSSGPIINQSLL